MRVTNQMINRGAKRSGLPIHQSSLLNQMNPSGGSAQSRVMSALQSNTSSSTRGRLKFKKQERAGDDLCSQAKKFMEKGEKGLFGKCEKSGDTSELCKEAERFTEKYNSLLASLNNNPDSLDAFYKQSLKEVVSSNKELLSEVGIVALKDGRLHIEKDKIKGASLEKLQEIFGEKSDFMEKASFIAAKVSDRASANIESASGSYSKRGNMSYYSPNKYDFWG